MTRNRSVRQETSSLGVRGGSRGVRGACALLCLLAGATASGVGPPASPFVVLVSANAEWKIVTARFAGAHRETTPFGESIVPAGLGAHPLILFHGGWGKIAAAASTQYAIERWKPELLINIGTCGGFRGSTEKGDVLLVDKTVVYDIVEQMGDSAEAIRDYTTTVDVSWIKGELPRGVRRSLLISGDKDIVASEIPGLRRTYGAVAADWESGAIAYVAHANRIPVLILRGVSDLVGEEGGEAYGNEAAFEAGTRLVMNTLMDQLPQWLARWNARTHP
jgi:adenosylhomocysteine nucleosidase